jgi:hypothetical protein
MSRPDPKARISITAAGLQMIGAQETTLRFASLAFGTAAAAKQFAGRKGHGGNPDLAERHLNREQMEALLAAAFEAGANLGNRRLVEALKKLSGPVLTEQAFDAARALLRELGEVS